MKDAIDGIVTAYGEIFGTSKIAVLFVLSLFVIVLIDEKYNSSDGRRRINPAVFLLSLWSGISYAAVRALSGKKRSIFLIGSVFVITAIILSGSLVISRVAYENSVYYYTGNSITILSGICILIFFFLYYLISRQLFNTKSDRLMFMAFVFILHLFDFYGMGATRFSLFLSPITEQSIIVHDVMPLILWLYLVFEDRIKEEFSPDNIDDTDENIDEIPEEWDMKKHKILNIRNMAIAFIAMTVVFVVVIYLFNRKINSLYDETVLLVNATNSKMTVDELRGPDGTVEVTVMISPEGSVTVLGGGPKSVGTETYEMIKKYTERVDKWYIYGDDEDGRGAYDFCVEKGIEVTETFMVTGIEKTE